MAPRLTFDTANNRVEITEPPVLEATEIDAQSDVYSRGVDDWAEQAAAGLVRRGRVFPFVAIGGQSSPDGQKGFSFIMAEDWFFLPYDDDHTLTLVGDVFKLSGASIWAPRSERPGRDIQTRERVSVLVVTSAAANTPPTANEIAATVWATIVDGASLTALEAMKFLAGVDVEIIRTNPGQPLPDTAELVLRDETATELKRWDVTIDAQGIVTTQAAQ